MPLRKVGARVEIDGEKEYKAALEDLNKGNAVLASEMRKLQAQYKGNEDSTEALTAKGELLERQLLQQKDKVQTLRDALASAAKEYGEADAKTQDWQIKLNNAEAAQMNLERAIKENNAALQSQGKEMVGLGDGIDQIASKLGVHLPDAAKNALNSIGDFSAGTAAKMAVAAGGVAALMKTIDALHKLTLQVAADVDEVITESVVTGLSTQTIQELKYAENLIDVSYSTITGSLTKLTQNMDKARDGNEDLTASFAELGVSITDLATGQLRPAEEVFYDIVDALGQIENPTERDAAAMAILGKSAQDLNPLIAQGSDALRELAAEANETGYVLDESQIQKLGEVDDAYQRMQLQLDTTKKKMAFEFAPASTEAMELFADLASKAGAALERSGLIEDLATIIGSLANFFGATVDIVAEIPLFTSALTALHVALKLVANVLDTISRGVQTVLRLTKGDLSGVKDIWSGYGQSWTSRWNLGRNATGNDNWRGGLTYINETGPEAMYLPSGTKILSAQDTRLSGFGGDTYYITIDARNVREFNDIVQMAQNARVRGRMR